MCGISCIYRYDHLLDDDLQRITNMKDQMRYRGPDGEGLWANNRCALGHVRLSIIGLENGQQPIFNQDKSIVLVCNGEIYNYVELKAELLSHGATFISDTDIEVIIHLYEKYGTDCLTHLRGIFAFCLYDSNKDLFFIARDRIGEEQLYYSEVPGGVVISSELKAILKEYIPE